MSQSSMASIHARVNQCSPLAEPAEGRHNVYGSFTTTVPASIWLQTHLSLNIAKQRDFGDSYDTPPDSPLSFFSGSRRSPSISRTLLTDLDWVSSSTDSEISSPSTDNGDHPTKLHPVLRAVENGSKLTCKTICSTCTKAGTNYPRCPRCDETWCSRECRLRGGKRHNCAIRKM